MEKGIKILSDLFGMTTEELTQMTPDEIGAKWRNHCKAKHDASIQRMRDIGGATE
ncbi:hypothetical protein [Sporosarcina psychrophila]|uniref:Uncharacterized protein n=1 Tax=Sporosarcina psychrophila TaxID=1476 RepID=A0ABV2KBQ5_SPOPS